jgi:hypothetical protein
MPTIQFMSQDSGRSPKGSALFTCSSRDISIYWWSLLMTVLVGLVCLVWFYTISIFEQPEKPEHYEMLVKLKKIEPLRQFSSLTVPKGKFRDSKETMLWAFGMTPDQFEVANRYMLRNYIKNFERADSNYITGSYEVIHTRKLSSQDLISSGLLISLKSTDIDELFLEIILPGESQTPTHWPKGKLWQLNAQHALNIINVSKLSSEQICVSALPITYQFKINQDSQTLKCSSPDILNLKTNWPLELDAISSSMREKVAIN